MTNHDLQRPISLRNFAIIAHIDHGKSTLADRLIELCGALSAREMSSQVLDSMDIERERGITIKAQAVTLFYRSQRGQQYMLNLIDTPGHVDFAYEVSRSLAACEGAILLVDAQQGVEAQTVATCYHAIAQNLTIVPVLNKIDLPQAEPERVRQEIEQLIGLDTEHILAISAKTGLGIVEMLEHIITIIPEPDRQITAVLKALVIDSWFDPYQGVVCLIRVFAGTLHRGDTVYLVHGQQTVQVLRLGKKTPKHVQVDTLEAGEVGYASLGIKAIDSVPVGDTMSHPHSAATIEALPGFQQVKPQVFAGIFPIDSEQYEPLRDALCKLRLNDSALVFEPEVSQALGFGFRCGFLGLLHMEIVRERLEREYHLDLLATAPSVSYQVTNKQGETILVSNPAKLPEINHIVSWKEPMVEVSMILPEKHIGDVIQLCNHRRGIQKNMQFAGRQITLVYDLPLNEIVIDFFDHLKSVTRGYGSMDYRLTEFVESDLVKVDVLVNGEKMDALTLISHRSQSVRRGRSLIDRLKELIPRQMFEVSLQAAIGGQIIARTNVKGMRKNVIAKCYGGDISRKRKLLEKQKEGKKKMKQFGKVSIPQEAFLAVLKVD